MFLPRSNDASRGRTHALPLALCVALFAACLFPVSGNSQEVVGRTPNLSGGWIGTPGTQAFHFDHRFWFVDSTDGKAVVNSPTFLFGVPLPGRTLVAGRYATRAPAGAGEVNEWEIFGRWAPELGRLDAAITAGYSGFAESLDGELSLGFWANPGESLPGNGIRLIAVVRGLSDALGSGDPGWFAGGGIVLSLTDGVALSADAGTLDGDAVKDAKTVWGAGLQARIPGSPHSISLFSSNARTGTLQGTSAGGRTVWGFEFTVPVRLSNFVP
ncbi:MAG: hypothetical protein WEG36_05245 [Gemmatimonadota bacterium]